MATATETDRSLAVVGWRVTAILAVPVLGLVFFAGTFSNRLSVVEEKVSVVKSIEISLARIEATLQAAVDKLEASLADKVRAEIERARQGKEGGR